MLHFSIQSTGNTHTLFNQLATPTLILGVQKAKAESETYLQGKFT